MICAGLFRACLWRLSVNAGSGINRAHTRYIPDKAFASGWTLSERAPLWILLLWAGLALTLNHSLAWLQSRLLLAALLSGVGCPLSYLAAERSGAVDIVTESWLWSVGLGVSWALVLPLLLWLASYLKQLEQEEQAND